MTTITMADSAIGSLADVHDREYFDAETLDEIGVAADDADAVFAALDDAVRRGARYAIRLDARHLNALAKIALCVSNTEDAVAEAAGERTDERRYAARAARSLSTVFATALKASALDDN
jgi:hypothetical protein